MGSTPLVLAHSSIASIRGRQLLPRATCIATGRGWRGALRALSGVASSSSSTVWLVDVGLSTVVGAIAAKGLGRRLVVDTGDAAYALARSVGARSTRGLAITWAGEQLVLRSADHVVVRGHRHVAALPHERATVIPDLAPPGCGPRDSTAARARWTLGDKFVVGLVGSLVWAPRHAVTYGWDLIEALAHCSADVVALVVGDGDGRQWLEQRALDLGVRERCRFVGRIEPSDVSEAVSAMDVGVSTQSTDLVGQVRTTGKLPLYLACGTPVLATHSGEAVRVLGPLGWTLPYEGVVDLGHPRRLAVAIERLRARPDEMAARRATALELADEAFNETECRARVQQVLVAAAGRRRARSRIRNTVSLGAAHR